MLTYQMLQENFSKEKNETKISDGMEEAMESKEISKIRNKLELLLLIKITVFNTTLAKIRAISTWKGQEREEGVEFRKTKAFKGLILARLLIQKLTGLHKSAPQPLICIQSTGDFVKEQFWDSASLRWASDLHLKCSTDHTWSSKTLDYIVVKNCIDSG